jgi:hypothetical protein
MGVEHLYTALQGTSADGKFVVFGYSQGGAVVSDTLRRIVAEDPPLLDKISSIVLIGNAYNPDGGLFTRLGFLPTIPFLDITFGPATPVDTGIPMTSIGFEYDPVMYAPLYWGNPLAMLNAFAAFDTVHPYYLTPNTNGPNDTLPYGYTDAEVAAILGEGCPSKYCRVDQYDNEYWMIPAKSLPLMDLIMSEVPDSLKPAIEPLVALVSPAAKVIIDLAYDWSGDPGETRYMSPLPFSPTTNWAEVSVDLVEAIGQGIHDAFGGGPATTIAPTDDDVSTLAANTSQPQPFRRAAELIETEQSLQFSVVPDDEAPDLDPVDDAGVDFTAEAPIVVSNDTLTGKQDHKVDETVVGEDADNVEVTVAGDQNRRDDEDTTDDVGTNLKVDKTDDATIRTTVTGDENDRQDLPANRRNVTTEDNAKNDNGAGNNRVNRHANGVNNATTNDSNATKNGSGAGNGGARSNGVSRNNGVNKNNDNASNANNNDANNGGRDRAVA